MTTRLSGFASEAGHLMSMEKAAIVDRRVLEFLSIAKHDPEPGEPSSVDVQRTYWQGGVS